MSDDAAPGKRRCHISLTRCSRARIHGPPLPPAWKRYAFSVPPFTALSTHQRTQDNARRQHGNASPSCPPLRRARPLQDCSIDSPLPSLSGTRYAIPTCASPFTPSCQHAFVTHLTYRSLLRRKRQRCARIGHQKWWYVFP